MSTPLRMPGGRPKREAAMEPEEFNRIRVKVLELTQGQLALPLGVSKDTVGNYERGEFPIPEEIASKVRHMRKVVVDARRKPK